MVSLLAGLSTGAYIIGKALRTHSEVLIDTTAYFEATLEYLSAGLVITDLFGQLYRDLSSKTRHD